PGCPPTLLLPPPLAIARTAERPSVAGASVPLSVHLSSLDALAGPPALLSFPTRRSSDLSAPYNYVLNTTLVADGTHTLTAVARDDRRSTSLTAGVAASGSAVLAPPPQTPSSVSPSRLCFGSVAIGTTSPRGHLVLLDTTA